MDRGLSGNFAVLSVHFAVALDARQFAEFGVSPRYHTPSHTVISSGVYTFANMPVGSLHSFRNATDKTTRMIITVAPAGLEKMFLEVGVPVKLGETPPSPSKAEIEKLLSVAPSYGVEIKVPGH